jgi:hypothetical protein
LILAGDALVVDLLEMEAMLRALVGTEKEAAEARRPSNMASSRESRSLPRPRH